MSDEEFFAHSRDGQPYSEWEPLAVHLHEVAKRANDFADAFASAEWGYLAGLWHDLGKYRAEFQQRIRGSRVQAEHAGAGAALAYARQAAPLAFVIAGHHAGLANAVEQIDGGPLPLKVRVDENREVLAAIRSVVPREIDRPDDIDADAEVAPRAGAWRGVQG